jgi:signal transduction histidine kinase
LPQTKIMHLLLVEPGVIITGLLLLGAAFVLFIYHIFLYIQYKERVIVAYSLYLFSLTAYITFYLISINYYPDDRFAFINYVKESMSVLTVLGYCYFLYAVLEEWHEKYQLFFGLLKAVMIIMTGYCAFVILAGALGLQGKIVSTFLPYSSRVILLIMAIVAAFLFFPLMKTRFMRLIKYGSAAYLFIVALIVLTIVWSDNGFMGWDNIYLFFAGVFIDIVLFSMAMAYKVRSVFTHIMEIKQKISQDLHDDIGASLSSLQIYSTIAEQTFKQNPGKAMEMLEKISAQSKNLMENMGDIVWSMKTNDSHTASLEARIKNFSVELLEDMNIDFSFHIAPAAEMVLQNATARKNVLLIIKEALNNIAKYSKASQANLFIHMTGKQLELKITDNGIGFDTTQRTNTGNGLQNMKSRAAELDGELVIESGIGTGTTLVAKLPVRSL